MHVCTALYAAPPPQSAGPYAPPCGAQRGSGQAHEAYNHARVEDEELQATRPQDSHQRNAAARGVRLLQMLLVLLHGQVCAVARLMSGVNGLAC